MFAKRGLEIWFEKIRFEWKGFGRIKYLPFIVDYILLLPGINTRIRILLF